MSAPSLVKVGQSQTLKRIYKVLSEFHMHIQIVRLSDGGHVFAQMSGVDSAWTFAYFETGPLTDNCAHLVYVPEKQPTHTRRGALNIFQIAPFLDQNYRTCQDYDLHFFYNDKEAVIRTRVSSPKNNPYGSLLVGECRVERLEPDDELVLDEPVLPEWVVSSKDFARWRSITMPSFDVCLLETNKDVWDNACKSLAKACAFVDVSFKERFFLLEGVMTEDVTQPRVLRYSVPATYLASARAPSMFKRTPETRQVFCGPKVRLGVRALHRAIHHQGPVRERHSRLLVQWLPCEGADSSQKQVSSQQQLTYCHLVLSTLYDNKRNGLSVALKDVKRNDTCPLDKFGACENTATPTRA